MKKNAALLLLAVGALSLFLYGCPSKEVTSAKVYIQQGDWDKAIEQLEQAVELYPQDAEANYLLGQGYGEKKEYEKMNVAFEKSLAAGPKFAENIKYERERHWVSLFNNGIKLINNNEFEKGKENFETCILIDPDRADAYGNLGFTYIKLNDMDKAVEMYETAYDHNPDEEQIASTLNSLLIELKEYPKAVIIAQKRLERDPANVDAISNLAMAYDHMDQKDKALETYQKALEVNPDNMDLVFNLGRLYFLQEDYDAAIAQFDKVIATNPEDFDANINVGNAYLSIADHMRRKAVEEEEAGKTFTDKDIEDLKNKISELHNQAIPYFEKAVSLKPDNSNAWYNLGVAYVNCGMAEKGAEAFDKAEELKN